MKKPTEKLEPFLQDKIEEFIWALDYQGYTHNQIGKIFKINRGTIFRIVKGRPENYKPKWIKST